MIGRTSTGMSEVNGTVGKGDDWYVRSFVQQDERSERMFMKEDEEAERCWKGAMGENKYNCSVHASGR